MKDKIEDFIKINDVNYNLTSLETLAWKKLVNGFSKKKNGFRTMCVGTIGENKDAALRIVVNRKVDELQKTIYFYTDNRSRKFDDLQKDNRISLLFYDARQKIQIAIKAFATLHSDDSLTAEKWQNISPQARLGYMTTETPNSKSSQPTLGYDERFSADKPTEIESDSYQKNFSVIVCSVCELEFLYLDYLGNRKANFYYKNSLLVDSYWAVP